MISLSNKIFTSFAGDIHALALIDLEKEGNLLFTLWLFFNLNFFYYFF